MAVKAGARRRLLTPAARCPRRASSTPRSFAAGKAVASSSSAMRAERTASACLPDRAATVAAVMRKLVHQIYGILRSGRTYDPAHA